MTDWSDLGRRYGEDLVDAVRTRITSGQSPQVDLEPFQAAGQSPEAVAALFEELVVQGELTKAQVWICGCGRNIDAADRDNGICPHCGTDFEETGEGPQEGVVFIRSGPPSREIPWLISIHGFNTVGEWQEEFNWTLATRFRHRAPVLNFKFPVLRYGVLFRRRHLELANVLAARLERALVRATESGIVVPPDIVAHSFGALLFSTFLELPAASQLRFGRVVLAGSIVRPDYDWSAHITAGRVQSVLCHAGGKDFVVDAAQFFIPNSGPSGRIGFCDTAVHNVFDTTFEHGSAFEPENMVTAVGRDGLWDLFLRLPEPSLREGLPVSSGPVHWGPAGRFFTLSVRITAIVVPPLLGAAAVALVLYPWLRLRWLG